MPRGRQLPVRRLFVCDRRSLNVLVHVSLHLQILTLLRLLTAADCDTDFSFSSSGVEAPPPPVKNPAPPPVVQETPRPEAPPPVTRLLSKAKPPPLPVLRFPKVSRGGGAPVVAVLLPPSQLSDLSDHTCNTRVQI